VKHGASLVTGSRRENSSLAPPSETQRSSAAATSSAQSGNSRFSLFSVRSLLGARPGNARSVDSEVLQWEVSRRRFGADSVGSAKGVANGLSSSARSAGRGDGVEVAGGAERAPTFDVSSNCVTPVFRVSPYLQQISVTSPRFSSQHSLVVGLAPHLGLGSRKKLCLALAFILVLTIRKYF
jgi:hypothetical protein